jgi:hypothetical protein
MIPYETIYTLRALKSFPASNNLKIYYLLNIKQVSTARMEPRAGFDPATNSLRGCRSTGLSHRGVSSKLSEIHVFKTFGSKQSPQRYSTFFCSVIELKKVLLYHPLFGGYSSYKPVRELEMVSPVFGSFFLYFQEV